MFENFSLFRIPSNQKGDKAIKTKLLNAIKIPKNLNDKLLMLVMIDGAPKLIRMYDSKNLSLNWPMKDLVLNKFLERLRIEFFRLRRGDSETINRPPGRPSGT